jgi:hypothetical protein
MVNTYHVTDFFSNPSSLATSGIVFGVDARALDMMFFM